MRTRITTIAALQLPLALLIGALSGLHPAGSSAQEWSPPRTVWIQESGHTVDGFFLDDWREYPELFGPPITEEAERPTLIDGLPADIRIVQYFENLAIAYVPEADERQMMVRALPIGEDALNRDAKANPGILVPDKSPCDAATESTCLEFDETGFTIHGEFLTYWQQHDGDRLIGQPISAPVQTADRYTVQYFENAVLERRDGGEVEARAVGKEMAEYLRLTTSPIPQPESIPIYSERLFIEPGPGMAPDSLIVSRDLGGVIEAARSGPGPQQGSPKEIVISISAQFLWAYEADNLVAQTSVSTGTGDVPETVTPVGFYAVHLKYETQTMRGTISEEDYEVEDVPWVMYFDYVGNAIHGTYWHNNFGTPMSHGCVNLPLDIAEFLYEWAPEGTAVSVIA